MMSPESVMVLLTFKGKNFVAACLQRKKRELRVTPVNVFQNRAGLRGYSVHCKRSWEGSCTCAKETTAKTPIATGLFILGHILLALLPFQK